VSKTYRECTCQDWDKNIAELNAGAAFMALHGMGGYRGRKFGYCPWCGAVLIEQSYPKIVKEKNNGIQTP
jgi:hypothetical protein